MNRIHRPAASSFGSASPVAPSGAAEPVLERTPESEAGAAVAFACRTETPSTLFGPVHYEPNYAYPLVVWLHGAGLSERQLVKIMPLVSLRNYVAVAPRGTTAFSAAPQSGRFTWSEHWADLTRAEHRIFEAVEQAQRRYHVAPRRIFLAGSGIGGTVALRLALMHPARFAGVLSLGGAFPSGRAPLARITECRRLPIFLGYGREDASFGDAEVAEQMRLFHAAGMHVSLRQYPGDGGLSPQMLADLDRWIMGIVTG